MYYGERFNSITHLAGAAMAAAGSAVLICVAARMGDPWKITSFAIYGATLLILYAVSTLYHSVRGPAKKLLRKLDHCAIYLLIAGTYTPFALVSLRGAWGWTLFGVVWGLAVVGLMQEIWLAHGARIPSLVIYLLMGWAVIVAIAPLSRSLSAGGLAWLIGGGLLYTGGMVFYLLDETYRHAHGVWHLFVMAGSSSHFLAVILYVA